MMPKNLKNKIDKNQRIFQPNFLIKNQKGELTTQQIVLLIILIVSFVIILFLLFRLNLGQESGKELCHNSVVMRGSAVVPAESAPLKCSRTYICITKDGSCEGLTKPEVKKVKTKTEIFEILAGEMAECWWMFGEGKVDYIGKDFFFKDNYCSICSQILFDNSLGEIEEKGEPAFPEGTISKDELYEYLFENKYSEDETYADYLFRESDINSLKQKIINSKDNPEQIGTFGEIDIGKNQYYVVMGITSEVAGRAWKIAAGAVVATVGLFIPGVGWTLSGMIIGAIIVGGGELAGQIEPEIGAIAVEGDGVKNTFMAPTIQEAESEKFKALNCEDVITLS